MTRDLGHGFRIRPWDWDQDDLEALTELLHRAYAGLYEQGLHFVAATQSAATTRERMVGSQSFVLEKEAVVVGTMTLSYPILEEEGDPPYYKRAGAALLSQFGIEPHLQGKGLGKAMFQFALNWCGEQGAKEITLDTSERATGLLALYASWGFAVVADHQWLETNYASKVLARPVGEDFEGARQI